MIRLAKQADIPLIMALVEEVVKEMNERGSKQWTDAYPTRSDFLKDIAKEECYLFVEKDLIKGVCTISLTGHVEYHLIKFNQSHYITLKRLAVHPRFRKERVAQKLVRFAEAKAKENNYHAVVTDTLENNEKARAFFEKMGYTVVDRFQEKGEPLYLLYFEKQFES